PAPVTIVMKKAEGKFFQEISIEGMGTLNKQVINGNKGYISGQGGKQDFTAEELEESKGEAIPFTETYLATVSGLVVEAIEPVDGNDAYVLNTVKTNTTMMWLQVLK